MEKMIVKVETPIRTVDGDGYRLTEHFAANRPYRNGKFLKRDWVLTYIESGEAVGRWHFLNLDAAQKIAEKIEKIVKIKLGDDGKCKIVKKKKAIIKLFDPPWEARCLFKWHGDMY